MESLSFEGADYCLFEKRVESKGGNPTFFTDSSRFPLQERMDFHEYARLAQYLSRVRNVVSSPGTIAPACVRYPFLEEVLKPGSE